MVVQLDGFVDGTIAKVDRAQAANADFVQTAAGLIVDHVLSLQPGEIQPHVP
jgi:hypothetical protein